MPWFQAKIGCKILWKRENKNSRSVPTRSVIENTIKILKNSKNTIMASLQAKIGWKMMRKIENKNYRFVRSY